MNPDEGALVLHMLLSIWEHAIKREDTLRLILNERCPGWNADYLKYWDSPGIEEHAQLVTEPVRKIVDQVIAGELSHLSLQHMLEAILKKAN